MMSKILKPIIGLVVLLVFIHSLAAQVVDNHKFISANIRVDLPRDTVSGNGWESRKDIVFEVLGNELPDIICFQEVLKNQQVDLENYFSQYDAFGFYGPEMDNHNNGYYGIAKNPIFYLRDRYELVGAGTYWLSDKPHLGGSKSWGTARARHVNWVRLKDKNSGKEFRVVNTHLDHISQLARDHQITMIMEECSQYKDDFTQILTGDFNQDAKSIGIKTIKRYGWEDSYESVNGLMDAGYTVHGFKGAGLDKKSGKVDFVFFKGEGSVKSASVIKKEKNGKYPSDHFFVSAELEF
ncbi:endonuclease/exonuclease/phosphatase family protein [Echinicola shivajiensis]|uniref:endonuclease/exonuclease/phosphatase family protein n=1 Tax=Echinicola shivajiensis TaxID=1035916 RepID=UPI001BFC8371|nr:endonuclease/exonuclease/phosphatase family protein [Echinicola shivajiensis]